MQWNIPGHLIAPGVLGFRSAGKGSPWRKGSPWGRGGSDNSMNPYLVPGLEATPNGPLCPFHTPEHERYYVPVDSTKEAFEQFQAQIGDLRGLGDEGRLVVVAGQHGCGKTALINRCATWLRDSLADLDINCEISSLTQECLTNEPIQHRMDHVFQCVVDDLLKREQLSEEDRVRALKERRDGIDIAYRFLSSALDSNNVVTIVLLPPSEDLVKEVERYAQYARKSIVFFAESSFVRAIEMSWPAIHSAGRVPPIRLEVGPLRERDGWLFAEARQEYHPNVTTFRKVSEATMRRVTDGWNTSIGQLQALLFGVYRELNNLLGPEGMVVSDEVTYSEITNYWFKLTRNENGPTP